MQDKRSLITDVADLPGVAPRQVEPLRRLGLRCLSDCLLHLPQRYELEHPETALADLANLVPNEDSDPVLVSTRGDVAKTQVGRGRVPRFELNLEDGDFVLPITWFHQPWLRGRLHPGMILRVLGYLQHHGRACRMVNPRWEIIDPDDPDPPRTGRLAPVYPASEAVPPAVVARIIESNLDEALALVEDHLPGPVRADLDAYRGDAQGPPIPSLAEAYRMMHHPADEDEVRRGRHRLILDELLLLQLAIMRKRRERLDTLRARPLPVDDRIDARIRARFPFSLTPGQDQAVAEIGTDLARDVPMNRLLQGDVGSGKTVVALWAMLAAIAHGHQAALMAPTELLAEQHDLSMRAMLAGSAVRVALLTGSLGDAQRRSIHEGLAEGDIDLVVGTHALLTESVAFRDLAVVVVDEQHRFGVQQRDALAASSESGTLVPHVLVMTATPIPRTLALTLYGDLDQTRIDGLPPGRRPVDTEHVPGDGTRKVYERMATRLARGEQAWVVVPVIDATEAGMAGVADHARHLRETALSDFLVEELHGRMPTERREDVTRRFRDGDIDMLVATTVIEVGVDVPNATMIVIEQADRFGLAQLHQLRGRVGRGTAPSCCVLVSDPATDEARRRISAILNTTDGFDIAEKDEEIRGFGELLGDQQTGLRPFHVARMPRDLAMLRAVRRDAAAWIDRNPDLAGEPLALLRRRLDKAHRETLDPATGWGT